MATVTLLSRALAQAREGVYLSRIGFEVVSAADGVARARLRRTAETCNRAGSIHGGAIASVLLGAAELAAASSERERHFADLRIAASSISFLSAGRDTELDAAAHVLRRGRDTVHVEARVMEGSGEPVASALLVYRVSEAETPRTHGLDAPGDVPGDYPRTGIPSSPYMTAAGAELLGRIKGWSCMSMPASGNEGVPNVVHDGAIVGLVDTCCALAVFADGKPAAREPSATVALSVAWADSQSGDLRAGARLVGRVGSIYTSEAQVWGAASSRVCVSALVCYRSQAAER